jgi:hypothetical protein
MAKMTLADIAFESFLDGLTGAGFFGKLRRPGAPTDLIGEIPEIEMNRQVQAAKSILAGNSKHSDRGRKSADAQAASLSHTKSCTAPEILGN